MFDYKDKFREEGKIQDDPMDGGMDDKLHSKKPQPAGLLIS